MQDYSKSLDEFFRVFPSDNIKKLFDVSVRLSSKGLILGPKEIVGRLSLKEEAAGKVRVFAMVDNATQILMHPLHKSLFN